MEGTIQEQTSSDGIFDTVAGYQHDTTLDYIDRMMEDEKNQGILLRVDSPEEPYMSRRNYTGN